MSYILEALRRSQAERERGRVPGLDAQPLPADPASGTRHKLPVVWAGGAVALLLLLLVLAAFWWLRPPPPAPQLTAADSTGATSPPSLPAPAPQAAPVVTPVAPPVLPQVVSVPPAPPPARPTAASVPGIRVAPVPPPTVPPAPPLAAAPQPTPAAARAVPVNQLSAEQRRDLPAMVVGGSIWSDNAANRFVIINGQLVREGEAAAPGVTLERIAPKAATLRWRDLRIELPL